MWYDELKNLFGCIAQDTMEAGVEFMNIESTSKERTYWIGVIDEAIQAAESGNPIVVEIVNASGYRVSKPIEAREYFIELGYLYLRQCLRSF